MASPRQTTRTLTHPPGRIASALALLLVASTLAIAASRPGPAERLSLFEQGITHDLVITGEAERVFLIFRIYDLAHYVDATAMGDDVYRAGLSPVSVIHDGPAKAIVIRFVRKLGQEQILREFDKSLRRNARDEWLEDADATIRLFTNAIDRDVQGGDELVFYWLPGGRLVTEFNGQRVFVADDPAFAKLLWSIWFGPDPVCDAEQLLAQASAPRWRP